MISAAEISITFSSLFLFPSTSAISKPRWWYSIYVCILCVICFIVLPNYFFPHNCGKLAMFHSKKNVILWPISAQAAQAPVVRLSSCEMSQGEFIRVWMEYLRLLLGIKKHNQFLNKNTSPYFHSASLVIWPLSPLTMLKRTHFSKLPFLGFVVNFYITL